MDKIVSDTIRNMRFPLIVMVVMLHTFIIDEVMMGQTYVPSGKYPSFDVAVYALKACLGEVAIPLFFVISGYLFFVNIDKMLTRTYKEKLKTRVKSLLVPYLCWNSFFILFVLLLQLVNPAWTGHKKMVMEFGIGDWLDTFWTLNNGLIPLWYVRDLIIISLLTPLIYVAIKKAGFLLPLILGVLYLMNEFKYAPGIGTRCSFLFVLGAYFGIKKINFFALAHRCFWILATLYAILTVADTYCWHIGLHPGWLNQCTLLAGVFALSAFFYRLTEHHKLRLPDLLVEGSFFIFVFHMFIIYIPGRFWPALIPVNLFTVFIVQILMPVLVSVVCIGIYWLLRQLLPTFTSVIVGLR